MEQKRNYSTWTEGGALFSMTSSSKIQPELALVTTFRLAYMS